MTERNLFVHPKERVGPGLPAMRCFSLIIPTYNHDVVLARMFRYGVRHRFETGHLTDGYKLFLKVVAYYRRAGFWRDLYRLPLTPLAHHAKR